MELAANALRDRQAEYSRVYWNIREVERELNTVDQELWQDQKDREEQALRQVQNAEQELEQARIAYEEAQQAEITGIQQAEAEVRNAEAALDDLLQGTDPDELAAARAEVGRARANLSQLQGEERSGSLAAAQAGVDNALSSLEQLTTEPREVDVASALAQIRQAEVSLELAQLDVQKATLRAPINATVAEVNLKVGEEPDTAQPDIVLADLSSFYVDVTVDEIDVANLELAQPVNLTLDALPELELSGLVETISPLSSAESAVTSYNVRIETQADNPRVRSGMSANADIVVAQKDDALIVPRRAVYSDQGALFVDVPTDQALCAAERETWPAVPELEAVEIEAGLRNDFSIEVLSDDIDEQTCVYVEGFDARLNPLGGPPPGHRRSR
jgi:HlyD family secretion protein